MKTLIRTALILALFITRAAGAENLPAAEELRAREQKMIELLKVVHGDDLSFRYLVDGYNNADEDRLKEIGMNAIWLYTEQKLAAKPVAPEKSRTVAEYRTLWSRYEALIAERDR